jgi:hypothetical protein
VHREVAAQAQALHVGMKTVSNPGGMAGCQRDLWLQQQIHCAALELIQFLWSVQSATASQGTLVYLPPSSCVTRYCSTGVPE